MSFDLGEPLSQMERRWQSGPQNYTQMTLALSLSNPLQLRQVGKPVLGAVLGGAGQMPAKRVRVALTVVTGQVEKPEMCPGRSQSKPQHLREGLVCRPPQALAETVDAGATEAMGETARAAKLAARVSSIVQVAQDMADEAEMQAQLEKAETEQKADRPQPFRSDSRSPFRVRSKPYQRVERAGRLARQGRPDKGVLGARRVKLAGFVVPLVVTARTGPLVHYQFQVAKANLELPAGFSLIFRT